MALAVQHPGGSISNQERHIAVTRFAPYGYSRPGMVMALENWWIVTGTIMFIYDLLTNIGSISHLKRDIAMTRFEPYGYSRSGAVITLEKWCIVTRTIMFIYDLLTNIGSISYLKRVTTLRQKNSRF